MTTDILLLLLGLVMVLLGADALVDGASSIARRYGISEFVIGVTIIAFGTSAPEMVVSFISSIEGRADMAVGNIIGSNIFNIAFVLGITALIAPVTVTKSNREWDIPFNVLVSLMLIVAAAYKGISRFDAAVFLAVFITYMWKSAVREKNSRNEEDSPTADAGPVWKAVLFTVGGLAMLIYGGDMFVKRAENIAYSAGLSDKFIGVTILAFGTSLPELAASIVAAVKGKSQMALGNVLGSNVFNVLIVLGGAALIRPLTAEGIGVADYCVVLLTAVTVMVCSSRKRMNLGRLSGSLLFAIGIGYMAYLFTTI